MNSKDKAVVQSLLQSTSEENDEDLSLQPQAKTSGYQSQGSVACWTREVKSKRLELPWYLDFL